jgi:membrane fusion protein (multidrug efflux system)
MSKKMIISLLVLFIIFGGVFGWYGVRQYFMKKFFATYAPPPPVVSVATATLENWQPYLSAVGNLTAVFGVEISSETSGQVKEIFFRSGDQVKKGQPLIQLDDSSEQAQLKSVKAQLHLAQVNDRRIQKLFEQGVVPASARDDSGSTVKQLLGNYENTKALIAKKLIRAPFHGKIGIKQINVGQYLSAGYACASLQSAQEALNVEFSLPQQDTNKIALNQEVFVMNDAFPEQKFKGKVTAIDSKVDENTRSIRVQATIENRGNKLLPGMFVSVKIALPSLPNSIVLPQTAITYTLYGDSAFLVTLNQKKSETGEELGTVKRVFVRTGEKRDNLVVILEGIQPGDLVVSSGQLKLSEGSAIAINNSVKL